MSKIREIPWPEEFVELKRIEESMVCGICYEYMETTVMTPCSHNYCSLCIRKYLHYKSQCPACFHVFFEKDLYINRAMDVLIQHHIKVREKLINLVENRVVYNTVIQEREETSHNQNTPTTPSTPPVRPVRSNQFPKSPKIQGIKKSEPKTPIFASTSNNLLNSNVSSPKSHKSPKLIPSIAKMFNTPKTRKETVPPPGDETEKYVSCPVCSVDISRAHINVHLDACLKREGAQKVAKEKQKPKRQPLPKLVLRVMKDAELRKKMKEFGLPTNGDRRALETRFTRYSTIYNAECDKLEPRPVADLIRQCEMEEKQERKMDLFLVSTTSKSASNSSSSVVRLQIEKDAKEDKIEEAQKAYVLANKSSFDKLIEEVRNRRKLEVAKKIENPASAINSTAVSNSGTSNVENDNIETSSFNPSAEIPFNDSDSDESCPLQHYKSDDPMPFLSSNLNTSGTSVSTSGSPIKLSQISRANLRQEITRIQPKNVDTDIYEASTDVSTDDEVQNSPVRSRNLNRKKFRLSPVSPKQSSTKPEDVTSDADDSIENSPRKALARELCNSIIEDFCCEGMSDDSFSEFSNKPEKIKPKVIENEQANEKSLNNNGRPPSRNKKTRAIRDKSVPEDEIKRIILGNFSSNTTDDWHNDKPDNTCTKNVNTSGVDMITASEHTISDNTKTDKENDVFVVEERLQSPISEDIVCRPVRKRNRPSRYTENQNKKQDVDESTANLSVEDSQESDTPGDLQSVTVSDGSLKRRRGRPKTNTANLPTNESLNPPKRPVRRRQAVAGHE